MEQASAAGRREHEQGEEDVTVDGGAAASRKRPKTASVSFGSPDAEHRSVEKDNESKTRVQCPYLGTINRHLLDFDFEKLCSISLANRHVYACLVCGKYFQGRGKNTYAYTHAVEESHYVFMNLEDAKIYCIPDNYLVEDASLNDIVSFLQPKFTREYVESIDTKVLYGKALDGTDFIPGCIGLNNLKKTDFFNVVIQALCCVPKIRNYLLLLDVKKIQPPDAVMTTFVELVKKIFNTKNFKGIVSPHEFVQAVGVASAGMYKIGKQSDPVALMSWMFNRLHSRLKNKATGESIVSKAFGGELVVSTLGDGQEWKEEVVPFRMLTLDVPHAPIFKDEHENNVIPKLPIFQLLQKFDGKTEHTSRKGGLCRYSLWKLPEYLVLNIKRFTRNNFFLEKNPTIVSFPMKNLDLGEYLNERSPAKSDRFTRYELLCNVCHQGSPEAGTYKVHIRHLPSGDWYELEDLLVTSVLPQFVAQSESYIQVYKRQTDDGGTTIQEGEEGLDMFNL